MNQPGFYARILVVGEGLLERIGRYEILDLIGSGAQGSVYRAYDPDLERQVAIKQIDPTKVEDQDYIEALLREARLAGSLSAHDYITTVHDVQVENGVPYIVMEYLPGSLSGRIAETKTLTLGRALMIAVQVARALEYAHQQGIFHRDIKPQNILLRENGDASVADFGMARASASSRRVRSTGFGGMLGTPEYMAPEQWAGQTADGRSDLYALGIVLYEMLAGSRPFTGDIPALYGQHIDTPMPPLPGILKVPETVERIVLRATEKKPDERYSSAGAMVADLEAVLSQISPDTDAPDSFIEISTDTPHVSTFGEGNRNRRLIVASAGIAIAVVIAVVLSVGWPENSNITKNNDDSAQPLKTSDSVTNNPSSPITLSSRVPTLSPADVVPTPVSSMGGSIPPTAPIFKEEPVSTGGTSSGGFGRTDSENTSVGGSIPPAEPISEEEPVSTGGSSSEIFTETDSGNTFVSPQPVGDSVQSFLADNKIVFVSDRDGPLNVYVMNDDGSDQQPVLDNRWNDFYPAVSPDRSSIAFSSYRNEVDHEIYLMNSDGTDLRRVTSTDGLDMEPAWSPYGNRIVFESRRLGSFEEGRNPELFIVDPDGDNTVRLTHDYGWDGQATWSPDGSRIAFVSSRRQVSNYDIYVVNSDSSSKEGTLLTTGTIDFQDQNPTWSPNGDLIAFDSNRSGIVQVYIMTPEGDDVMQITTTDFYSSQPTWSPDGKHIAFTSCRDQQFASCNDDIYIIGVDGTGEKRLTRNIGSDFTPSWSR